MNPLGSFKAAYDAGVALIATMPEVHWVITAQDPFESGLIAYAIARKTKSALHLQLHTDPEARAWKDSKKNRVRDLIYRFLAPRADAIRAVSERAKHSLVHHGADASRITVVPVVSDEATTTHSTHSSVDIRAAYKEASEIILAMGRLSHEKGFDVLIEAMRSVSLARPSALLLLVGSGPEEHALKKRVLRLGLSSYVRFVPWVRDVAAYFRAADVVVMPSRFEGWGLVACEAARHGRVVVMTDTGCAGEVIVDGETGLVVPPEDPGALSDAITRVLSNDAFRGKLGTSAEARARGLVTNTMAIELHKESWETAYRHATETHTEK
jgi:glycosyltransferase involved in cell wall biosynthesis